jgi:hypothetical protein
MSGTWQNRHGDPPTEADYKKALQLAMLNAKQAMAENTTNEPITLICPHCGEVAFEG